MKDYQINIFYSEEDEAYIADIPDLKYCSAIGETPQQALNEVILAKTAWLEAASKTSPKLSQKSNMERNLIWGELGSVTAVKSQDNLLLMFIDYY